MPDLSTRTSRRQLGRSKVRVWVRVARGRAIGYRRPGSEAGTWYARVFRAKTDTGSPYVRKVLGTADDIADADGEGILSYGQAVEQAVTLDPHEPDEIDDAREPLTVRRAVERYLEWYKVHRRSYDRIRYNLHAHVLPELGDIKVEDLTTRRLRTWHQKIAEKPARLRGKNRFREAKTEDQKRARKVTANQQLKDLKAVLNRAVEDGLVENATAWQRVKGFRGVEAARTRYLDHEELQTFLKHCPPDFAQLVRAAVYTGARISELTVLRAEDFRPEASAVHFKKTKTGHPRYVYLADEGLAFFEHLAAGLQSRDLLLLKDNGKPWGRNHHYRLMKEVCEAAGIEPLGFHQLRHTYASLYLMSGGSLVALAKQLGHTTTRMVEKHYGHLADSWRAEEARKYAPSLGLEPATAGQ